MPICIECRHPVRTLWREGAGDKSGGHNIRLTVCKNCGRFCDKYVEHDFVVLFIDLVLIKPQVRALAAREWEPEIGVKKGSPIDNHRLSRVRSIAISSTTH